MFKTLNKHSPTRGKNNFEKILIRSQVIAKIPCTANIVSIDLLETNASERGPGGHQAYNEILPVIVKGVASVETTANEHRFSGDQHI